ncbi:MAG: hypothetical protein BM556_01660 [Bacteriovorax sp. MedPE-SWde]|nr:MAG: hypothetical protein BM556_01660 [Bacteriovorax sp. MedPE-SWde]
MNLIDASNIDIGYTSPLQKGLNISVESGDFILISGPNGSGKTTLLKTLLKEIPAIEGRVVYNDGLSFSYLPQLLKYEFPISITLKEILEIYEVPSSLQSFIPEDVLDLLWDSASGGQRQKVLVLSRLAKTTDILFLDEPFNHVDRKGVDELMTFLLTVLEGRYIKSIVIISHISPQKLNSDSIKSVVLQ